MAGWRFCFREQVGVSAELPDTVRSLELQQKRSAQGGIQTARNLLPTRSRGPCRTAVRLEAGIHLLGHIAHAVAGDSSAILGKPQAGPGAGGPARSRPVRLDAGTTQV